MKEYIGNAKKPLIGSNVYLESAKGCDDWRGTLIAIYENAVLIEENGKRKLVPFHAFINMVVVDDLEEAVKNTKPYKL